MISGLSPNPAPVLTATDSQYTLAQVTFQIVGKHEPALDGLRGLAILPVVAYHFADQFQAYSADSVDCVGLRILQAGWIGVDLFFVLSGFLITGILLDTRTARNYYPAFYGRRVLRIFPAYYATLIGFFVFLPWFSSYLPTGFQNLAQKMLDHQLWFWCYAANWLFAWEGAFGTIPGGYLWSLAVEEQFYLVWPVFVQWLNPNYLPRAIFVLLVAGISLRLSLLMGGISPVSVYTATFTHMDGLLAGSFLACMIRRIPIQQLCSRGFKCCAAISGFLLMTIALIQGHLCLWDFWVAAVGLSLLAILFSYFVVFALIAQPSSRISVLLRSRQLRSYGKYSYAIYLLHVPIGLVMEKLLFSPPRHRLCGSIMPSLLVFILLGIAICWITGFLSWHLLEKHFLKLKRFFPSNHLT